MLFITHIPQKFIKILFTSLGILSAIFCYGITKASDLGEANSEMASPIPGNSLIQRMNEEQLTTLVSLLLEMDSIPEDLMYEITLANERLKKEKLNNTVVNNLDVKHSEFYSTWDEKKIFPEADRLRCKDTCLTLLMGCSTNGGYTPPCNGGILTSRFGWRDSAMHNGIDIDLNKGDQVFAVFDGVVRIALRHHAFGNVVVIRHASGLETVYAHLSKLKVKSGQSVLSGQVIGLGGATGRATGTHLHFETRFKGVAINPQYFINWSNQTLVSDTMIVKKTKLGMSAYSKGQEFHTVQKGDTVFEIAKRYGTSTKVLVELNGLPRGRIRLKAGQVLKINQN